MKRKYKIQINYKSGTKERFWVRDYEYKSNSMNKSFSWTTVRSRKKPINANIDEIESIWCIKKAWIA